MRFNEMEMNLISIIEKGSRKAPIKRQTLVRLLDTSDRAIRNMIQDLRNKGVQICSSNSGGYWIAADQEDLDHFLAEYTHYAKEIFKTARAMSGTVGQMEMKF